MRKTQLSLLLACVLVCGLAAAPALAGTWFWKPGWPDAPSGMPDFDMNQDFDNADGDNDPTTGIDPNYCTPTATANSIWWYGSIPGGTVYHGNQTNLRYPGLADVDQDGIIDRTGVTSKDSPMDLVQALAWTLDTNDQRNPDDAHQGTWIPSALWGDLLGCQPGTQEYVLSHGAALKTRTYFYPSFDHMQSETLSCHDVVLHVLVDPNNPPGEYPEPEGADAGQTTLHSVTVAGVDCGDDPQHTNARMAISDNDDDAFELGGCPHGRALPAGHGNSDHGSVGFHAAAYDHQKHNDPTNVSHDGYDVTIPAPARAAFVGAPPPGFGLVTYLGEDVVYATVTSPTADRPISFSVAPGLMAAGGAEGLNYGAGAPPPGMPPNDVWDMGNAGVGMLQTEGEIFESHPLNLLPPNFVGVNQLVISGAQGVPVPMPVPPAPAPPGALGLNPGDNINALSYGMDSGDIIYFSVDDKATGVLGTGVNNEAVQATSMTGPWFGATPANPGGGDWPLGGNEAAGDIFKAGRFAKFGPYFNHHVAEGVLDDCWVCDHSAMPANVCFVDEVQLGLQAPANNGSFLNDGVEDDLDALEYASTSDPVWGIDSLDAAGASGSDGFVDPGRYAFFSLDAPPVGGGPAATADDILVYDGTNMLLNIYADGVLDIGLLQGDDLDALILSDVQVAPSGIALLGPNGILDPGLDEALFSLAVGSPSLGALYHPGDLFYTDFSGLFSLWVDNAALGLLDSDELNALDTIPGCIPEPAGLSVLVLGVLGLKARRRRT